MKVGFIGSGNMAQAIISGMLEADFIKSNDIYCYDIQEDKLKEFCDNYNINATTTNNELVNKVDYVVLAIKPQFFNSVLSELKEDLIRNKTKIISIAAGTTIEKIELLTSNSIPIFRIMPNINAIIGESVCAICSNNNVTLEQTEFVHKLFDTIGLSFDVPEKDFSTYIAIASSSPAFTFMYIDALARAALKNGLNKELATRISAQAVLGSAKMILESNKNPWELVDMVSSPAGTTVAGVVELENNGFVSAIFKCVQATIDWDKKLMEE